MSTTPPRRHSPAVYRRRRLMVLLLLLIVIGGIVAVIVWQPWRALADVQAAPASTDAAVETGQANPSPAMTPAGDATPTGETAESPASTPSPEPSGTDTAAPVPPCTTSDITVMAMTDQASYGGDQKPQLSISLTNDGPEACIMNVGTATQKFEITSGSDTWWRSTDCQTESSDQVVQIEAGQTVASAAPLEWDRTRSSVDTCDGQRQRAPGGWFHLSVSIGGIEAADSRMFQLN
ncbi:hypothetical protein [Microbacterium invictum]|uniref:Cytoskeletal protein RodZ n=1 Tax=Microbacterium invictum TaxID=515415 RepID=A0AA40SQB0_9MICO|nr:hypothetical protein [Microbacterium invictum]MBB4140292.1 cytoskeletal protein RodZ [Microbacterium invictum]